uniref:Uncharacterized protein n=1 Tax=Craspedostauros australis TaxID=1486917 RepID=A0A7S0F6L6_9STRA
MAGAAVAGGVAGLLVAGPALAVVAAGGAALAVTSKSKTGDVARAGGDAVAATGDRLKKIDQKHHIVEKTGKGLTKGLKWVERRMTPRNSGNNNTQQQQQFGNSHNNAGSAPSY